MSDKLRDQLIAKAMKDCKHFNGIQRETCKAGVNYRELVGGPYLGWAARIPCTESRFLKPGDVPASCEKRCVMTREEAEQSADADLAAIERSNKAFAAAHADAKTKGFKKGNGGQSSLPCPVCAGGTLRYSVAAYNGHMHAMCSTENCVSWME